MKDFYSVIKYQLYSVKAVIRHHYAKRHVYGNAPAREWIAELRRIRVDSGFFE